MTRSIDRSIFTLFTYQQWENEIDRSIDRSIYLCICFLYEYNFGILKKRSVTKISCIPIFNDVSIYVYVYVYINVHPEAHLCVNARGRRGRLGHKYSPSHNHQVFSIVVGGYYRPSWEQLGLGFEQKIIDKYKSLLFLEKDG